MFFSFHLPFGIRYSRYVSRVGCNAGASIRVAGIVWERKDLAS